MAFNVLLLLALLMPTTSAHAVNDWQPKSCLRTPVNGATAFHKTKSGDWEQTPQGLIYKGLQYITVNPIPLHMTLNDLSVHQTYVTGSYFYGRNFALDCYPEPNHLGTVQHPPDFNTWDGCPSSAQDIVDKLGPHNLAEDVKPDIVWKFHAEVSPRYWQYIGPPLKHAPMPLGNYAYTEESSTMFLPGDYVSGVTETQLFCSPPPVIVSSIPPP